MPTVQHTRHFFREWREYRQLTQRRLADRIGTTAASISRMENLRQIYTQPVLEALADALQCTPGDLLSRKPENAYGLHAVLDRLTPEQFEQAEAVIKALTKAA